MGGLSVTCCCLSLWLYCFGCCPPGLQGAALHVYSKLQILWLEWMCRGRWDILKKTVIRGLNCSLFEMRILANSNWLSEHSSAVCVYLCVCVCVCVYVYVLWWFRLGLTLQTQGPGEGQAARLAGDWWWWGVVFGLLRLNQHWSNSFKHQPLTHTHTHTHTAAASDTVRHLWLTRDVLYAGVIVSSELSPLSCVEGISQGFCTMATEMQPAKVIKYHSSVRHCLSRFPFLSQTHAPSPQWCSHDLLFSLPSFIFSVSPELRLTYKEKGRELILSIVGWA